MNIGDTIQCSDVDDLIKTMIACAKEGIETDFDYNDKNVNLVVTAIRERKNE